ncbi:MAG TPA: hypothetical protein GXX72_02460, partial [Clostridiaceae bacterium]|nr:hypothetical protein [Clostridiaceae bacterium]
MAYADADYYKYEYSGTVIPDEALANQLSKASDQVDSLTYNRIRAVGFDQLTEYQQGCVKKAVCSQADFNVQYGAYADMPLKGYKVGDVSVTFDGEKVNGVATTKAVLNYLGQAGL